MAASNIAAAPAPRGSKSDDHVARTVEEITRLEGRDAEHMGWSDHIANLITAFSGSMLFVWVHVAWFAVWIVLNLPGVGIGRFDEFPFGFLTMVVSLEAIFLSTFVLISQNHQAIRADRRAKVDLEINLIAEEEITTLIKLVAEIHQHLGLESDTTDELEAMLQRTHVKDLADAADEAEEHNAHPKTSSGPADD